MFDNLWFWTSWPKKEKVLLWILLALLACSGAYLIVAYWSGGSFVLDWIEGSVSRPVRVLYDRFNAGLYEFSIFADNYILVKSFHSGNIEINVKAAYVFIAVCFTSIVFLLALASSVSRFYFIISCVFFIVILVTLKLENILLFGWYDKETLFLTLASFLLPIYYLHAFKSHISVVARFGVLMAIAVALGVLFYFFSEVDRPFFYIASYGIVVPVILSVVFILMVGFEVVKGFLTIITKNSSGSGKTNFIHFSILSVIYIVVLVFIYLYNEAYISWKLFVVNAVWLLLGATVLGFWGFKEKEVTYAHIFRFKPVGAYMYVALALICFSTLAYFFASANDALVEVLEDAVIFSQLSYSLIFFVYVLANFFPAMMEGFQVHRIIHKPQFMPYFSARLAALIGVLALFLLSNKAAYYQTFAGYYISLANLHLLQKDDIIAKEYYELSNIYGRQTHFGNFALAKMAGANGDTNSEENYLARSINRNPTEFAFADLAKLYEQGSNFFDALFVLKHGVNYFPDSGPLAVNLGTLLSRTNILDSAAYYYLRATEDNLSSTSGLTNIYSLYALKDLRIEKDSLKQMTEETNPFPVQNNLMVLAAQKGHSDFTFHHAVLFNEGITVDQLVYNFNALLYSPETADSVNWKTFRNFYAQINSVLFKEELEYAFALAFAKNNHSIAAIRIFDVLNREDSYGYKKYDLLMAQYFMKFGAPLQAIEYYENTFRYYGANVVTELGMAYMEAGKLEEARDLWSGVVRNNDSIAYDVALEMLQIINYENLKEVVTKDDYMKHIFLRYRQRELSHDEVEGIILSIQDPGLQAMSYTLLLSRLISEENFQAAVRIANKIPANFLDKDYQFIDYLRQMTLLAVKTEDMELLEELLPRLESYGQALRSYQKLANAMVLEFTGFYDKAEELYRELSVMDAFCEECILQSARYLDNNGRDKLRAYNVLVDAVEINKYSILLNKAYVELAIALGLDNYADDITNKLDGVLHPEDFDEFEAFVEETKSQKKDQW